MGGRRHLNAALVVLAWARFQPRTAGLARDLGGEACFVHGERLSGHLSTAPLRYLAGAARTWRLLSARRPRRVIAVSPPVFAPLTAWAWCRLHGRRIFVDCHTDAFDSLRWGWARPLHRWLLRRCDGVLLHTRAATARVAGWGARALLVPDDLPSLAEAGPPPARGGVTVLVAGSLDGSEPVAQALAAAALLPGVRFKLTGDPHRLPREQVSGAPPNVEWTGYLPYAEFLAELLAADVVAAFSTDPGVMNRAAFEAVGLGRPLVLTDFEGLRDRFGAAALFTANDPGDMAATLERAVAQAAELARRSSALAGHLAAQRYQALLNLAG